MSCEGCPNKVCQCGGKKSRYQRDREWLLQGDEIQELSQELEQEDNGVTGYPIAPEESMQKEIDRDLVERPVPINERKTDVRRVMLNGYINWGHSHLLNDGRVTVVMLDTKFGKIFGYSKVNLEDGDTFDPIYGEKIALGRAYKTLEQLAKAFETVKRYEELSKSFAKNHLTATEVAMRRK